MSDVAELSGRPLFDVRLSHRGPQLCVSPLCVRSGQLQNLCKFKFLEDKLHFFRISAFTLKITLMTFIPVLQT